MDTQRETSVFHGESSTQSLWISVLDSLKQSLSQESFETWFKPIRCSRVENLTVHLSIPNRFYADWIGSHFLPLIIECLCQQTQKQGWRLNWEVDASLAEPAAAPKHETQKGIGERRGAPRVEKSVDNTFPLNPKYEFKNFVVGPSNELAYAAAVASAAKPGRRYNPLFIYGGTGLGKTHLVNAIGHRIQYDHPQAKIVYVSAERFTNEFIHALQNQSIHAFRNRYRQHCDVLLVDDIQFLAGRIQTQEEFFHTFNALYQLDNQIVVTSDAGPHEIQEMEGRLVSRFQSGLVADVQIPELDTRIAILKKKAEQEQIDLPDEGATYLAQAIKSNIRELEGTLIRLAAKAELQRRPLDFQFVRECVSVVTLPKEYLVSVDDIQKAVCEYYHIRLIDLKSAKRQRSISLPRMVAMYLCRRALNTSYPELGLRFGGKDHTTALSAVRRITAMCGHDESLSSAIHNIQQRLGLG